ncbi:CsbD family protein [Marinobacter segnicrescens]|uniref:CsbD family protein n=1 Tax=Marinobacter segnicrescens TaxID=430453 RepID=UPI003A95ADC0
MPKVFYRTDRGMNLAHHVLCNLLEELTMNWDTIKGNWKQFKGEVRSRWGKLTDDQLDVIAGEREKLAGHIQESYGVTRDEAEKQIEDFEKEARK